MCFFFLGVTVQADASDTFFSNSGGTGIKLILHDPKTLPNIDNDALALPVGMEVYVSLEKKVYTELGKPYSENDCQSDHDVTKSYKYVQMPKYTRQLCIMNNIYENMHQLCGCLYKPAVDTSITDKLCSLGDIMCIMGTCGRRDGTKDMSCPRECNRTFYAPTVSMHSYPQESEVIKAQKLGWAYNTTDSMRENLLHINIYYNNLQETLIRQDPAYPANSLISDFGGQLGLFLGASLISMAELLDFIFTNIYYKVFAIKKKLADKKSLIKVKPAQETN